MTTAADQDNLRPERRTRALLMLTHALGGATTFWFAHLLRFDFRLPDPYARMVTILVLPAVALKLLSLLACGVHRIEWRYVTLRDVRSIGTACLLASALLAFVDAIALPRINVPRSVLIMDCLLTCLWVTGTYAAARTVYEMARARRMVAQVPAAHVIIVGAGDAGELVLRDIARDPRGGLRVARILDDHRDKIGRRLHGIDVDGPIAEGAERAAKEGIRKAIIAIPSAGPVRLRQIAEHLLRWGFTINLLPSMERADQSAAPIARLRELKIEDLLRRDPVRRDPEGLRQSYMYRAVLVTGAAGSIGSELCRQLLQLEAARIIALDRAETPLVMFENELRARYPESRVQTVLADVTDAKRIRAIIEQHKPSVVFHAAAVKHVPVAESNPAEAIRVNVLGTRNVMELATELGVPRIVMISTDKAVQPANVMGATKRLAELVTQSRGGLAVRFGNVLGSNGSVVNIFREQIARGGPVTVTHPEMKRFFMTIPEAVHLVLETARFGRTGGVYMLDMGQPVKIVDLAHDMIRLAGLQPEKDIQIAFTGIRPGEKLNEDLCMEDEQVEPTEHPQIVVARGRPPSRERADGLVARFEAALADGAPNDVLVRLLKDVLPEYTAPVTESMPAVRPGGA